VATALATLLLAAVVVGDWLDAFPSAPLTPPEPEEAQVMAGETPTTLTETLATPAAAPAPTPSPAAEYRVPKALAPTPEEGLMEGLDAEKAPTPETPTPSAATPTPTLTQIPGEAEPEAEPSPGWPVRQLEYGFLGAAVVLAGLTLVYWRRFRLRGRG